MNKHLQLIQDIIQNSNALSSEQQSIILKAVKSANNDLSVCEFKLDRTEKVKRTTGILLEETIEELEQKRKAVEVQAELIRAEYKRKTLELEEARQLQLSMLPRNLPELENLEISVHMHTATEVGGDYYDFSVRDDGSLIIAIGDATGHGLKAGIMVSAMKSIFTTNAISMDIRDFFHTANSGIKSMNLKRMMMGFTMLNLCDHQFEMVNAGMPPVLKYVSKTNTVTELREHAVPIGAMRKINFRPVRGTLDNGDALLFLTDGLPELHNSERQMYGYTRICESFKSIAAKSPDEIVNFFKTESKTWAGDGDPEDDITLVVIKLK